MEPVHSSASQESSASLDSDISTDLLSSQEGDTDEDVDDNDYDYDDDDDDDYKEKLKGNRKVTFYNEFDNANIWFMYCIPEEMPHNSGTTVLDNTQSKSNHKRKPKYPQLFIRLTLREKKLVCKNKHSKEKESQFSDFERIQELENQLREKDNEIKIKNQEKDDLEKRYIEENQTLHQRCSTQSKRIQEQEEQLKKKDCEIMKTNLEKDDSEKRYIEENQNLQERCNAQNSRIQELEEKLKVKEGDNMQISKSKESLEKRCKHNEQQWKLKQNNYDEEIKNFKSVQESQSREIKRLQEYSETYPALQKELTKLETQLHHSKQQNLDADKKLAKAEVTIKTLAEKVRVTVIEKEELLLRLSKMAGTKLTHNNPNIADLSDEKRPTKLAEEFSELYDNEWTDAFECVDIENEQDKTSYMLFLLQRAYELCVLASRKHLEEIKTSICTLTLLRNSAQKTPCQGQSRQNKNDTKDSRIKYHEVSFDFDHLQDDHKKAVTDLRKFVELKLSSKFEKIAVDELSSEFSVDRDKQENLYRYINKCVNICWSMRRAEVPVAIGFTEVHDGMLLDTTTYKPYTQTGKYIDYIVWPALYLHKNGPLLCKGVAQGKSR